MTDKRTYAPGSAIRVKFIVTNNSEEPLHLYRGLSYCSGNKGFVFFLILDHNNQDVRNSGCSADSWPPGEDVNRLADTKFWILLKPAEIYGHESTFDLPAKKGTYRLRAELTPTNFTAEQRETLSQKHMRVLQNPCLAPIVTITVK